MSFARKTVLWSNMCNGKVPSWMFDRFPNMLLSRVMEMKMQFDGTRGMTVRNQKKVKA